MPPAQPRSSPGLGCHPTCTSSSSRLLCRFLHVPPYILGEGEPRPLPSSTRVAVGGSVWDNAWQTPLSATLSHLSGKRPALGWRSDSRPRPLPGPQAGALRREEEGEVGGAGRSGASLRGKYFGCGPRGAAGWPHCAPGSAPPGSVPCVPLCQPPSPRPRPPPGAGRAGGVVRAARVTALSARGASTGRSVSAPNPPRAQPAAGRPSQQGDAARARAGAPGRPLTAPPPRPPPPPSPPPPRRQWTREPPRGSTVGAAPLLLLRPGLGERAGAPLPWAVGRGGMGRGRALPPRALAASVSRWAELLLRSRPGRGGPDLGGGGQGCGCGIARGRRGVLGSLGGRRCGPPPANFPPLV